MTPEDKQALHEHTQAIAKILFAETPAERLATMAGIEQAVREQMQEHVMPEVGVFLSKRRLERQMGTVGRSKASLES